MNQRLTVGVVAAELGVEASLLRASVERLLTTGDPGLAPLAPLLEPEGSVERAFIDAAFAALACAVGDLQNRPTRCP